MAEEQKTFSFSEMYETAISNKQLKYRLDEALGKALREKRAFGLKKYGENSFQGNLENCMTSPTLEHATEELIDCINYLLHEQYKMDMQCLPSIKIEELLLKTVEIYKELKRLSPKHI